MVYRTAAYDAILQRAVRNGDISPEGKEWLVCAADPFHDTETHCTGYPDDNAAPSIVQLVKRTITVDKPSSVSSGTWDCHIVAHPYFTDVELYKHTLTGANGLTTTGADGPLSVGGITAIGVQSGTSTSYNTALGLAGAIRGRCTVATSYFTGPARVIAAGFEVTNTTAPIEAQGQVVTYRNPYPHQSPQAYAFTNGTVSQGSQSYVVTPQHPPTLADAMTLTGSRQWHARDGAYVPLTFNSVVLPPSGTSASSVMHADDDHPTYAFVTELQLSPSPLLASVPVYVAPFNQAGAYFTGLSTTTTLQIALNIWVERFPDVGEADLMPLASPSPPYDVGALELYSRIMRDMPTGVPVNQNGLGDWFAAVVKKAVPAITSIAKVIPHPIAQGLGVLGDVVAGDANDAARDAYQRMPRRAPPPPLPPPPRQYSLRAPPSAQASQPRERRRRRANSAPPTRRRQRRLPRRRRGNR